MARSKVKPAPAKVKRRPAAKLIRAAAKSPLPAPARANPGAAIKTHLAQRRWNEALSLLEADSAGTASNPRMMSFHAAAMRSALRDSRTSGNWTTGLEICRRALNLGLVSPASSLATAEFAASAALAQLAKQDVKEALEALEPIVAMNLAGEDAWKTLQRPIVKLASSLGHEEQAPEMSRLLALFRGRGSRLFSSDVERSTLKSLFSALKEQARSKKLAEAHALIAAASAVTWSAESVKVLAGIIATIARLGISAGQWQLAAGTLESLENMAPGQIEADTQLRRLLRADAARESLAKAMIESKCSAAYLAMARAGIWQSGQSTGQAAAKAEQLKQSLARSAEEIARLRDQIARLKSGAAAAVDGAPAVRAAQGLDGRKLSEAQAYVLNEMQSKGICKIAFADFFGADSAALWESTSAWMTEFSTSDAFKEYMVAFSTARDTIVGDEKFRKNRPNKLFEFNRADYGRALSLDEPCIKIGLRQEVLDVAGAYLGTAPKMRSAVSWVHVPMFPSLYPRQASQQWHRDQEDGRIFKLFTLFSDVDIDTGPFEYIPESTPGGRYAGVWDFNYSTGGTGYPPPGHVEKLVPPEDRYIAVAKRGSLVFVDTCGLHRGGYVTLKPRVATQTTYLRPTAPARILQNPLYNPSQEEARSLTPEQLFAIG
jgi:hypothetical protein